MDIKYTISRKPNLFFIISTILLNLFCDLILIFLIIFSKLLIFDLILFILVISHILTFSYFIMLNEYTNIDVYNDRFIFYNYFLKKEISIRKCNYIVYHKMKLHFPIENNFIFRKYISIVFDKIKFSEFKMISNIIAMKYYNINNDIIFTNCTIDDIVIQFNKDSKRY